MLYLDFINIFTALIQLTGSRNTERPIDGRERAPERSGAFLFQTSTSFGFLSMAWSTRARSGPRFKTSPVDVTTA